MAAHFPIEWVIIAGVAVSFFVERAFKKKTNKPLAQSIREEQRHIAGVWAGETENQPVFLELKAFGQVVDGSYVKAATVTAIANGTFFPPKLYFEMIKPDGSETIFRGSISPNGQELRGSWSDFVTTTEFTLRRVPLTPLQPAPGLGDWRREYREEDGDDNLDVLVQTSSLAPLLVYSVLDAVLQRCTKLVPEYDLESVATLVDATQLQEPLFFNDGPPPSDGTPIGTSPLPSPAATAQSPSPAATAQSPAPAPTTHSPAPAPTTQSPAAPTAHTSSQRCPKCDAEWQDAFSFCLQCGYTR